MHFLRKAHTYFVNSLLAFSYCFLCHGNMDISVQEDESMFEITSYSANRIQPILPLLQEWGERGFIQYPYLWVPPKGEIFIAYAILAEEENSLVTIVKDHGHIVGVAAGLPFDAKKLQIVFDEDVTVSELSLSHKAKQQGFDPSRMFYMSYFLTAPEYHNDKRIVELIYKHYVAFIQEMGREQICYFDDVGKSNDHLKPSHCIEPWRCVIGDFRSMNVKKDFSWPTLQLDGSVKEEVHQLEFFVKNI